MKKERREFIKGMIDVFDDLPDGAFLAALEEQGIDVDELAELSREEQSPRKPKARAAENHSPKVSR